jgi:ketosteroid isomerase-like protein
VEPPLKQLYDQHLAHVLEGDLQAILDDYADDAILTTFQGVISGRAALARYYGDYLNRHANVEVLSTDAFVEALDALYIEATVRTEGEQIRVYNAYVMSGGKIAHQLAGLK